MYGWCGLQRTFGIPVTLGHNSSQSVFNPAYVTIHVTRISRKGSPLIVCHSVCKSRNLALVKERQQFADKVQSIRLSLQEYRRRLRMLSFSEKRRILKIFIDGSPGTGIFVSRDAINIVGIIPVESRTTVQPRIQTSPFSTSRTTRPSGLEVTSTICRLFAQVNRNKNTARYSKCGTLCSIRIRKKVVNSLLDSACSDDENTETETSAKAKILGTEIC